MPIAREAAIINLVSYVIEMFEGLRLTSYKDPGGVWTIGFGRTQAVEPGQTCSRDEAVEWLTNSISVMMPLVNSYSVATAAGYLDFGYNCGMGALQRVLSGKAVLSGFVHDKAGNILPGLVRRRAFEQAMIEAGNV